MEKTRRLRRTLAALACLLLLSPALPLRAAWNEADVADVASALRNGRGVHRSDTVRDEQAQFIYLSLDGSSGYLIDFRAHLCYAVFRQGVTIVPCQSLKQGYPLFAPLLTWEQDGFGAR